MRETDPPVLAPNATGRTLGAWGEEIATRYLEEHGFTVLARNWRCRWGELDIVCADAQSIHAVEVKTRRLGGRVPALQAISPQKRARLRKLLCIWLVEAGRHAPEIAVDLCAITVQPGAATVNMVWRI